MVYGLMDADYKKKEDGCFIYNLHLNFGSFILLTRKCFPKRDLDEECFMRHEAVTVKNVWQE